MNGNRICLRPEEPQDYRAVEELTREAFWNRYAPGCTEHYLAHVLRDSEAFVKELDTVALVGDRLVGNIMYTRGRLLGDDGSELSVLCFGPLSVLPAFQGRGVGGTLIERTKEQAAALGHDAILIYGDPAYYERFGFVPAEAFGIGTEDDCYADTLQALELRAGILSRHPGRFVEAPVFHVTREAATAFDASFPPKRSQEGLPSQERFQALLQMRRPRRNPIQANPSPSPSA